MCGLIFNQFPFFSFRLVSDPASNLTNLYSVYEANNVSIPNASRSTTIVNISTIRIFSGSNSFKYQSKTLICIYLSPGRSQRGLDTVFEQIKFVEKVRKLGLQNQQLSENIDISDSVYDVRHVFPKIYLSKYKYFLTNSSLTNYHIND